MRTLLDDLRAAARSLVRRPRFNLAAVGVLAVGLGSSLVVWSWIYSMVWRPFPGVPKGDELLIVATFRAQGDPISLSVPDALDLRRELAPLADLAAAQMLGVSWTIDGTPSRAYAGTVSSNYFSVLGVVPQLGRAFEPGDDRAGAAPTAVLSHKAWQRQFGGDPGIVGRAIAINRRPFTVVGIAAEEFRGTEVGLSVDLWVPLGTAPVVSPGGDQLEARDSHWLRGLARLRPGVARSAAQAALDALGARLARQFPKTNSGNSFRLLTLVEAPWGATHFLAPILGVLGAMVLLMVAATAANVAGLLVVRACERRRELAVRLALGADRGRLARALFIENALLALGALALGALVLPSSRSLFLAFMPPVPVPVDPQIEIGLSGIAVGVGMALLSALLASIAPVLDGRELRIDAVLREESAGSSGSARQRRFRGFLIGAQVALGFVLFSLGALFLRALEAGRELPPGFEPSNLLLADLDLHPLGYDRESGVAFLDELRERLAADPGVVSASFARRLPLDLSGSSSVPITIAGYAPSPAGESAVRLNQVGVDYFRTMGIELVAGRAFTPAEVRGDPTAERVAIVSLAMARRYWQGGAANDRTIEWGDGPVRVVGVARDVPWRQRDEAPQPFLYLPHGQRYDATVTLHVRTRAEPLAFVPRLRELVRATDPDLPITTVKSMAEHLGLSLIQQRAAAAMLSLFGGLALLLAVVGLYGVVALALRQRLRELALRAALGASPAQLVRLAVGQAARTTAVGLAAGISVAAALAWALRSLLLGLPPFDPLSWLAALIALGSATALASWLPARRAARLDAAAVLREG